MNKESKLPQNEIDVILKIFKRFKKMIIGFTLMFTLGAIYYAIVIHKPIYSAIVLVQLGKKNNRLVEVVKTFELKFSNQYKINSISPEPFPRISKVKIMNGTEGIIRLYAEGYSRENLKGYLENTIQNINIDHNESIEEFIHENNRSLVLAQKNLQETKATLKNIQNHMKENEIKLKTLTNKDQTLINLYLFKMLRDDMSIEPLHRKITTYTNQVRNYTRILSKKKTFGTHMINEVITFENPITLSKSMLIIIGFISGFIFTLLLAFLLDLLVERKK